MPRNAAIPPALQFFLPPPHLVGYCVPAMSQPANETAYSLTDLSEKVGPIDPDLREALIGDLDDNALVKVGKEIASTRILTDVRRLYSLAYTFWEQASPEQRRKLRGFSLVLLGIAVEAALQLDELYARHENADQAGDAARASREAEARSLMKKALPLRDQARLTLSDVAGSSAALGEQIDRAAGTAGTPEALVKGLNALAEQGQMLLDSVDTKITRRAVLFQLDQEYVQQLKTTATELDEATKALAARPAGPKVTQGQLDRADGLNVHLFGMIMRAFERGHDIDATIPRLVPIAMRRLFYRRARKPQPEPETT